MVQQKLDEEMRPTIFMKKRKKINVSYSKCLFEKISSVARATCSLVLFFFFQTQTSNFKVLENFKKYMDVDNVGFIHCENFQIEIHYILPSVKITKSHKMTKSRS
jgi:hypothetical protein